VGGVVVGGVGGRSDHVDVHRREVGEDAVEV
jgi:hypothetical protein